MKARYFLCVAILLCVVSFCAGYLTSVPPKETALQIPETRFVIMDPVSKEAIPCVDAGLVEGVKDTLTVYILTNAVQQTLWGCGEASGCRVSSTALLPVKPGYFPGSEGYMTMQKLVLDIYPDVEEITLFASFAGDQTKELCIQLLKVLS